MFGRTPRPEAKGEDVEAYADGSSTRSVGQQQPFLVPTAATRVHTFCGRGTMCGLTQFAWRSFSRAGRGPTVRDSKITLRDSATCLCPTTSVCQASGVLSPRSRQCALGKYGALAPSLPLFFEPLETRVRAPTLYDACAPQGVSCGVAAHTSSVFSRPSRCNAHEPA